MRTNIGEEVKIWGDERGENVGFPASTLKSLLLK